MTQNANKLPMWKKIIFGSGDIYAGGAQQLVSFLYLFFLTDIAGLRPALAGAIVLICRIWDSISDPIMGVISDRTRSKLGRRRPYFLAGTVLILLSFSSLWLPVNPGTELAKFLFFLTVWLFHETICSMVLIPFYALGTELTADYKERSSIMFYRLFISTLTIILVAVLPKIIVARFADVRMGYAVMGAGFSVLFSLPWLLIFFTFKEDSRLMPDENMTIAAQVIIPLRIKLFRRLVGMFIMAYSAIDILSAMVVFYVTYYLGRSDYNIVLGSLLIGQTLFLPFTSWLSKKIAKPKAFVAGLVWWLLALSAMAMVRPATPAFVLYVIVFLMGGGTGAGAMLTWAMYPDVADVAELATGKRHDALLGGFVTFARKAATALSVALAGVAMDFAGYIRPVTKVVDGVSTTVNAVQPNSVLTVIRLSLFAIPALLIIGGIALAARYPLTPQLYERIQKHLGFTSGKQPDGQFRPDELNRIVADLAGKRHLGGKHLESAQSAK